MSVAIFDLNGLISHFDTQKRTGHPLRRFPPAATVAFERFSVRPVDCRDDGHSPARLPAGSRIGANRSPVAWGAAWLCCTDFGCR